MKPTSPGAVLARIPGWEESVWQQLSGGLSNRTWLVETSERKAVLKIDDVPRSAPFNSRLIEWQIQTIAADAGIANPVIYADECVYLCGYVEADVWMEGHLQSEENLAELATGLRLLHALPLTGRSFNAVEAAGRYSSIINAHQSDTARSCVDIVRKLYAPQNFCCCHNDLVVGNIISTPALRFLDWEYACDNDPFFDLATIVAHHELSREQADFLLDRYFDGNGARWRGKLVQQSRLYNALLWLWMAARPETDEQTLLAIAERLA